MDTTLNDYLEIPICKLYAEPFTRKKTNVVAKILLWQPKKASKMVDLQPVDDIGLDTDDIKRSMLDRQVYITSLENWDIFNMPVVITDFSSIEDDSPHMSSQCFFKDVFIERTEHNVKCNMM